MDLDQQLRCLIEQAPQDGTMPRVMEQAIAPVLKTFAGRLKAQEYYICQSLGGDWLVTTLAHRTDPQRTKTVVYGFETLALAQQSQGVDTNPSLVALAVPVTHLLFKLFSLAAVESVIFSETQGSIEIRRQELQQAIQEKLLGDLGDRPQQTPPSQWA